MVNIAIIDKNEIHRESLKTVLMQIEGFYKEELHLNFGASEAILKSADKQEFEKVISRMMD